MIANSTVVLFNSALWQNHSVRQLKNQSKLCGVGDIAESDTAAWSTPKSDSDDGDTAELDSVAWATT